MFLVRYTSQNVFNLFKFKKNIILGKSNFGIIKNQTVVYNINVNNNYRKLGIGSNMLNFIENYSKMNNINLISLVAKQEPNGLLTEFYLKNGYKFDNQISYYDDGYIIYDMISMSKELM